MDERFYVLLDGRGVLKVAGADRRDFLQGLISNDIRRVGKDRAIWAALLTPQGKFLHDFFVVEIDDAFYLDCEAERLSDLGQRLARYKLRAKVDLEAAEGWQVAAAYGGSALAALGLPVERGAATLRAGGAIYVDPRLAAAGARAVLPPGAAGVLFAECGFREQSFEHYDRFRLELGLPDGSRDMEIAKSVLLECNFDALDGIDWEKGCYVGQEVTARTRYRGLVKRRLVPVRIEGGAPAPGTPVRLGEAPAGELRSVTGDRGLALLRLDALERVFAGNESLLADGARLVAIKPDWADF